MDWLLRVKQAQEGGDPTGVVSVCRQALGEPLTDQIRANVLLAYSRALMAISPFWLSTAVGAVESALELVDGTDAVTEGLLLATLTAITVHMGLPDQMEGHVARFEQILLKHPSVARFAGDVWHNQGVVYEGAGMHERAVQSYQQAIDAYRAHPGADGHKLGETTHNLALVLLSEGRIDEAQQAEQEARALLSTSHAGAQFLLFEGRLAALQGRSHEARAVFEAAMSHDSCNGRTTVDVLVAWARLDLAGGQKESAVRRARQAQSIALRLPYREVLEQIDLVVQQAGGND